MTLEELLREAASKGLTHLSLHTAWSADHKTVYWAARATPSTGHSYIQAVGKDPVDLLTHVLLALPKAPKRAAPASKAQRELEVTATVNAEAEPESELDKWLPKT